MEDLTVLGDLTVNGNHNLNPFWVAGKVNGAALTNTSSVGKYGYLVERSLGAPEGRYKINFNTPHTNANYVVNIQTEVVTKSRITEVSITHVRIELLDEADAFTNVHFHFMII